MGKLSTSKKLATTITYLQIITQTITTLFLTRFYIRELGEEAYGLYNMIYSVAQFILILDLGISTTMVRYITEFDTRQDHKKAENFAFHMLIVVGAILFVTVSIGIVLGNKIDMIYPSLNVDEIVLSQRMFKTMILQISITILCHYFQGIAMSYDRYTFVKGIAVLQIASGAILSVIFVLGKMGIEGIVRANTIVIALNLLAVFVYDIFALKFKVKFHFWDFKTMRLASVLMFAMLLQSIVGYVNSSVDKTILGNMATKSDVAIYSLAASIITMFNALPTAISSVYQPDAVRLVTSEADSNRLTDFVARPGRIQFVITGGFVAAFSLFGKDFVQCWVGTNSTTVWAYVLIILVPNMIPLVQNTVLAILNAKDKRVFRSLILGVMVIFNIGLTIMLVKLIGPIGAPIATGASYIIGHCVIMNIYYKKALGLNVIRMFREIARGILPCVLVTAILCFPLVFWQTDGNWIFFIIKCAVFSLIFMALLVVFGFNDQERAWIKKIVRKLVRR